MCKGISGVFNEFVKKHQVIVRVPQRTPAAFGKTMRKTVPCSAGGAENASKFFPHFSVDTNTPFALFGEYSDEKLV